jgi:hypothetical protein
MKCADIIGNPPTNMLQTNDDASQMLTRNGENVPISRFVNLTPLVRHPDVAAVDQADCPLWRA